MGKSIEECGSAIDELNGIGNKLKFGEHLKASEIK
jgi:hypothetical protein